MSEAKYLHLDPIKDHESIVRWMVSETWAFDIIRATEIALLKTFAIPGISKVLVDSGEFLNRTQKRYDDTDLLLSLFIENGYSSPEGRRAIVRINRMHAKHPITNRQMLYVLSTFVVEPIVWIEAYGRRQLNAVERESLFHFWNNVGQLMAIKDLFKSLDEMLAYHELYEREHMVYDVNNASLYHGVLPTVVRMMPVGVGAVVAGLLPAIMSPRMCAAFGVKPSPAFTRGLVQGLLRIRGFFGGLVRTKAELRTKMRRPTYPNGYTDERLGV